MDLFELKGVVAVDTTAAVKAMESAGKSGEKLGSGLTKAFEAIGKSALALGKTAAAAVKQGTTAVVSLTKSAVSAYSEYEQLVGGVETLFGESSSKLRAYAAEAYKTAGMSANDYMETATGFAASLVSSLEGDTAAAAEIANMAITDMADNANKMGTDISSIQNAYQGFAKQNYTMLDNLKLGYGGTKKEMERLLSDAEKLTGIKYNINSFSDIANAIHAVQEEMGITGTTAEEAASTVQGSIASVKASLEDLFTAVAADDLSTAEAAERFAASVATAAENIIPRVRAVLEELPKLIVTLAPKIASAIPTMAEAVLPTVTAAAENIVGAAAEVLPELATAVTNALPDIMLAVKDAVNSIAAALPPLLEELLSALPALLPALIATTAELIYSLSETLSTLLPPITEALPDLVITVAEALVDQLPILIEAAALISAALVACIPELAIELVRALPELVDILINGIEESGPILYSAVKELTAEFAKELKAFTEELLAEIKTWLAPLAEIAKEAWDSAANGIKSAFGKIEEHFESIREKTIESVDKLKTAVAERAGELGGKLIAPFEAAADAIGGAVERVKGFFDKVELSFPNIKLPHFTVEPSGWNIGDLLKGSIPTLGVEWYAEAQRSPIVMRRPTVFGVTASGKAQIGGEAGEEVVSGTSVLRGMIEASVERALASREELLSEMTELLERYLPRIATGAERELVLDDGAVAKHFAPLIDAELGRLRTSRDYGR